MTKAQDYIDKAKDLLDQENEKYCSCPNEECSKYNSLVTAGNSPCSSLSCSECGTPLVEAEAPPETEEPPEEEPDSEED